MATTPRQVIDAVVRSVCGHEVAQLVRLTSGGVNETYRGELAAAGSIVVRIGRHPVPWFTDEAQVMAQARAVGVPTPDVLGVAHVDHAGALLSFSIQRLLPGRALDALASELPAADLERLVMDGGELLARVHSVVPDRGIRHELQPPDERSLARGARIVEQTLGLSAASVVERGAEFLRRELAARAVAGARAQRLAAQAPPDRRRDDRRRHRLGAPVRQRRRSTSPAGRCPLATACTTARTCCAAGMRGSQIPTQPTTAGCPRSPSTGRSKSSVGAIPRGRSGSGDAWT